MVSLKEITFAAPIGKFNFCKIEPIHSILRKVTAELPFQIYLGVFKTPSNINGGAFCENILLLLTVNYFCIKLKIIDV